MRYHVSRATLVIDFLTLSAIFWLVLTDAKYTVATRELAESFRDLVQVTQAQTEQLNKLCIELKCDVEPDDDGDEVQP
jgi:hypothetical protein